MPLSKVALMCIDTSPLLINDILFLHGKSRFMRSKRLLESTERPSHFPIQYEKLRRNPKDFFRILNLSIDIFDYILEHVKEDVEKTVISKFKTSEEKLFITLRYLTGAMTLKQLARVYCSEPATTLKIISTTLVSVWNKLSPIHFRAPTPAEVNNLAKEFYEKWRFPNCMGAIGGKYIRIVDSVTDTNKKMILNGVVDANFRFVTAYFETKRSADKSFVRNMFDISGVQCLPDTEVMLPLFVIGNEAYPLKSNLMKPYASKSVSLCADKERFNDKLKQARVPVDCAFEILTEKWKIFSMPFTIDVEDTKLISKCACLLHNIIKDREGDQDPHFSRFGHVDNGCIYLNLVTRKSSRNRRTSSIALSIRDQLKNYLRDQDRKKSDQESRKCIQNVDHRYEAPWS